jgi:DNA polymerase alpha subunit B
LNGLFTTRADIFEQAHSGRINQSSVLLEGSRNYSHGERINVDLSLVKDSKASFSLFPGQIVALEGLNVSGRKMVVSRICEGASFPAQKSRAADLMNYHYDKQDGSSLKIMSVCGPYTTSDNLDYEPMLDLFNVIRAEKPDVAILTGPFVDMRHKLVVAGETMIELENGSKVSVSYETFFANKVAALLEELFENERGLHTQFVLVPSLDDAVAEWV